MASRKVSLTQREWDIIQIICQTGLMEIETMADDSDCKKHKRQEKNLSKAYERICFKAYKQLNKDLEPSEELTKEQGE